MPVKKHAAVRPKRRPRSTRLVASSVVLAVISAAGLAVIGGSRASADVTTTSYTITTGAATSPMLSVWPLSSGQEATYTVTFVTNSAVVAESGAISISETSGPTNFSTVSRVLVSDATDGWQLVAVPGSGPGTMSGTGSGDLSLTLGPNGISSGAAITLTIVGVTNPGPGVYSDFDVSTTGSPVAATVPSYFVGTSSSALAQVMVNPDTVGSVATYTITGVYASTAFAGGSTTNEIGLSAPPGTVFPDVGSDYTVTDATTSTGSGTFSLSSYSGNDVVLTPPNNINFRDALTITIGDVTNPSSAGSNYNISVVGSVVGITPSSLPITSTSLATPSSSTTSFTTTPSSTTTLSTTPPSPSTTSVPVPTTASPPPPSTHAETTGGVANTWTDYLNAGGMEGPQIPSHATVQITCAVQGFRVADGNTWWYLIASSPWSNQYYVSADPFYNNGQTSGSLLGTPFVDPAVPLCPAGGSSSAPPPPRPVQTVILHQGPPAPAGYRYAITLSGFWAETSVTVTCYDSASPHGFYTFTLRTDGTGSAFTQSYCYSGDGPDHWVIAGGVQSNTVVWGSGGGGGVTSSPTGIARVTTTPAKPQLNQGLYVALGDSYSSGEGNPPYQGGSDTSTDLCHRSTFSYAFQANLSLGYFKPRFSFHACSGATVQDFYSSNTSNREPPQLSWLTGAKRPISLVTLTIGGNNAYFAQAMEYCALLDLFVGYSCQSVWAKDVNSAIRKLGDIHSSISLVKLYRKIKADAGASAKVLVLGYPRLFPARPPGSCATGVLYNTFGHSDMLWLNHEAASMDATIAKAAREAGVTYVSDYNAFAGHELCTLHPYLYHAIATLHPKEIAVGSFHPNAEGQLVLSKLVSSYAKG